MTKRKIYVVVARSGEYSGFDMENVAAFLDEAKAEAHALVLGGHRPAPYLSHDVEALDLEDAHA
jgi:hypothetical protein